MEKGFMAEGTVYLKRRERRAESEGKVRERRGRGEHNSGSSHKGRAAGAALFFVGKVRR
jgi:hypothetical protein